MKSLRAPDAVATTLFHFITWTLRRCICSNIFFTICTPTVYAIESQQYPSLKYRKVISRNCGKLGKSRPNAIRRKRPDAKQKKQRNTQRELCTHRAVAEFITPTKLMLIFCFWHLYKYFNQSLIFFLKNTCKIVR